MNRVAEFSKVSYEQFEKDWLKTFPNLNDIDRNVAIDHIKEIYDNIKLPKRATMQSAGNDFFSPISATVEPGESIKIPTGIRCEMYDGWVLMMYPRSGLGAKNRFIPRNLTGIVDGDYCESDNEGHIFMFMANDGVEPVRIEQGAAFCQGVLLPFGIALDDDINNLRNGGFGSTGA